MNLNQLTQIIKNSLGIFEIFSHSFIIFNLLWFLLNLYIYPIKKITIFN